MKPPSATHAPKPSPPHRLPGSMLVICLVAIGAELARDSSIARGQTIVPPTINTTTWSPAGNPFIITDNSTVPAGQTLTIQPGVIVWIGEDLKITVNGSIQAIGTPTQRITLQAPTTTQHWGDLVVNHDPGVINRFRYCDFENASTALSLVVSGAATMVAEIMNCTFRNCVRVVYGQATGLAATAVDEAYLNPVIKNCVFRNSSYGCGFKVEGRDRRNMYKQVTRIARGFANPALVGNLFVNITNQAVFLDVGSYPGSSSPDVLYNSFVQCGVGGARKAFALHKRFQQINGVAILALPVRCDPPHNQA